MTDEVKTEDFRLTIAELVPEYQRQMLLDLLSEDNQAKLELAGRTLLGECTNQSFIVATKAGPKEQQGEAKLWTYVQNEVYEFLCTNSKSYSLERKDGKIIVKDLVQIVATASAAQFSLSAGIFTGAATVAVMIALKIGVNTYCKSREAGIKP